MKPTLNEKIIACLALFSGLSISMVAEYYSIFGFTAIFAAAVIPVIIMGVALGLGKITATLWLKQNWAIASWTIRIYLLAAIVVLMGVTSMGIFGFLSKAHSDQSLVSGDVLAKISVYDEKIKTSKENIDANRKALKQMDEAVDQVMGRSTSETGADKAVQIRRVQQKERSRILADIEAEQKKVSRLMEDRAPVAAEVRKVEAEVGPIKYIAAFVYGSTDTSILEKSVTWIIILLIVVFDPLAVILLLASQTSFQNFRERELQIETQRLLDEVNEWIDSGDALVENSESPADNGPLTEAQLDQIRQIVNDTKLESVVNIAEPAEVETTAFDIDKHPYLFNKPSITSPPGIDPVPPQVYTPEAAEVTHRAPVPVINREEPRMMRTKVFPRRIVEPADEPVIVAEPAKSFGLENYVQNEEQNESNLWTTMNPEEFINSSQEARDEHIANIVAAVKARTMEMSDVPELLQNDVKARV